ncbi:glycosyltransferase [Nocardioides xinjiangensis]|uniref:glycosyltransferase n=1 Tax=Nocardioides xinjiangensis TaxID=2817376 RepID=UPI001B318326|nr:glycosyltransferase [Nocardioides sp. SYSU D00778]
MTVVVPLFNAEPFVVACLDSLRRQTWRSLEVLVVDDASTDRSADVVADYFASHPGFRGRLIRLARNSGVSSARNTGVRAAGGEYIGFVDPDDVVEDGMFEALATAALSSETEAAACGATVIGGRPGERLGITTTAETLAGIEVFERMCTGRFPSSVCFMLFAAEVFDSARFTEGYRFEDFIFLAEALPSLRSVRVLPEPMYRYFRRGGSETGVLRPSVLHLFVGMDVAVQSIHAHIGEPRATHLDAQVVLRLSRTVCHQAFAFGSDSELAREVRGVAMGHLTWNRIKVCIEAGDLRLALSCAALKVSPWLYGVAFRARRSSHGLRRDAGRSRRP